MLMITDVELHSTEGRGLEKSNLAYLIIDYSLKR